MVLTKVDTGSFEGKKGATATLKLIPREAGKAKAIAAAYGEKTVPVLPDGTIEVTLEGGKKSFAVVYAATSESLKLDLCEVDDTDTQKLRFTTFDPAFPTVQIFIGGK